MIEEREQLVEQWDQRLHRFERVLRSLIAQVADARKVIVALRMGGTPAPAAPVSDHPVRVAVVAGRRLTGSEAQTLDENDCDIILDLTAPSLRYRRNPKRRSKLQLSRRKAIGPDRTKILALMIERFGVPLCTETVDRLLGDDMRAVTSEAFTKSMSVLRQALGGGGHQNHYIQSTAAWDLSPHRRAHTYRLNPRWSYLLIKHKKF